MSNEVYTPSEIYKNPKLLLLSKLKVKGDLDLSYDSPMEKHLASLSSEELKELSAICTIKPLENDDCNEFVLRILPADLEVVGALNLRLQTKIKNIPQVKIKCSGYLDLAEMNLKVLPNCTGAMVTTFDCSDNMLKSLKGAPLHVKSYFLADNNRLRNITTLSRAYIGGYLDLSNNPLSVMEIKGLPKVLKGKLYLPKKLEGKSFPNMEKYSVSYDHNSDPW